MGNRFWRTWPVVVGAILISTFAYVQGRRAPERATVSGQASSYAGGRFALLMDGEVMGFLKSVSGGIVRTDPATHDLGPRRTLRRNAKLLAIKPVAIDVGMGMSEAFYEWIEMAFDGEFARRTGQIHAVDFDMQSKSVREFRDARIVEVTFPELDGSSKDPAYMTVKLAPEKMISGPGTGQTIKGEGADRRKQWLCSNFRIEVGDFPCDLVSKIDSFTWKQAVTKDEVGQFREPALHPTKVEIPNIKLTISIQITLHSHHGAIIWDSI